MQKDLKILPEIEQLIRDCIRGEHSAQSELYNVYNQKMFAICLRYARNREEAEDILQEGFLKIFQCIDQYKFEGAFEGWMRKIMVNCALQKYRSKAQLRALVDIETAEIIDNSDEEIIATIGKKELLEMVQKLPPCYKLVFNLYVFEGYKHREIASLLNISEGTSKSNLSDARLILQKAVKRSLQPVKIKYN